MKRQINQWMCSGVALLGVLLPAAGALASPAGPARFATVQGRFGLRWNMSIEQVKRTLAQRRIKAKHQWQRGQFQHGCVRTDTFSFVHRGWQVTVTVHQYRLSSIWISKSHQSMKSVTAALRGLTRRYGAPERQGDPRKIKRYGEVARWQNQTTQLVLSVSGQKQRFRINQSYQRR